MSTNMYPNYLYSCQMVAHGSEPWNRKVCLHFIDRDGIQRSFFLVDHDPFVLLRFVNTDIDNVEVAEESLQHILSSHNTKGSSDLQSILDRITSETQTPVVGFSNNRSDILFKVHLKEIYNRGKLTRAIDAHNETEHANDHVIVLHRRVNDIMSLLHETGWRLHTWYNLDISQTTSSGFIGNLFRQRLEMLPSFGGTVHLPILYFRISARSSTATRNNIFQPDHSISDDCVEVIQTTLRYMDEPSQHVEHAFMLGKDGVNNNTAPNTTYYKSEHTLLTAFTAWLQTYRPCIIVHMSEPFDQWSYVHFRMLRYGVKDTLSMFSNYKCAENTHMQSGEFRDLTCPGREIVDLLHVLQKFMITPNLDGYTIEDVVAHPSLLRRGSTSAEDTTMTVVFDTYQNIDTTFQPLHIKQEHTFRECHILRRLESDNSFVVNNIALSHSCDLSLGHIISRGQQTRVFSCFMREYCKQRLYLNHTILEQNYLTVKRHRADSSFPDKPWIKNPPLDSLTTKNALVVPAQKKPSVVAKVSVKKDPLQQLLMDNMRKHTTNPTANKKVVKKKRYGGGFVICPVPGFYHEARHSVVTLDFASLYPSIMCGYRICYMRVCYDSKWLTDPRATKEYIPLDDTTCCVMISHYDNVPVRSITDTLVWDVMKNRKQIRTRMKTVEDAFVKKSLDAQQLCCKVLQNAFYGACGSDTFAIPCTAIAASVCVIGQWMNKTVRHTALQRGCICVYGDTDSVMVQFPTDASLTTDDDILASIYTQAAALERDTTACFPSPNAVEFETMKRPFLMTDRKKTYAAFEYAPTDQGWKQTPSILVKGFTIKKRDRCSFVQLIGIELVRRLLTFEYTEDQLLYWFMETVNTTFLSSPNSEKALQPFIISCRLNDLYKQENVIGPWIASKYEEVSGMRPLPGKRLKYVIAMFSDGRKHYQSAVVPSVFVRDGMKLDVAYYLNKQLMLAIKQVLNRHVELYTKLQTRIDHKIQLEQNKQHGIRSVISFFTSTNNKRKFEER